MNVLFDYSTIKASKRHDHNNPITAAFHALEIGVANAGHTVVRSVGPRTDVDCVFVFGSITQRKKDTERAKTIQFYRDKKMHIFSLDSAFFSTYIRERYNSSETGMFRIGYGDCVGGATWFNRNSPSDRFEMFKSAYGFEEGTPKADNDAPILFLLQSEKGWQYDNEEPFYLWARKIVEQLREITDREIVLRAHPNLDRNPTEFISKGFENVRIERCSRQRVGLIESVRNSGAVITHSSSGAIEAYVEGVPTFALDRRCVVYDDLDHGIDKINQLNTYNWNRRYQNLCDWSYTSWHIEEMKKPEVVSRYLDKLKDCDK